MWSLSGLWKAFWYFWTRIQKAFPYFWTRIQKALGTLSIRLFLHDGMYKNSPKQIHKMLKVLFINQLTDRPTLTMTVFQYRHLFWKAHLEHRRPPFHKQFCSFSMIPSCTEIDMILTERHCVFLFTGSVLSLQQNFVLLISFSSNLAADAIPAVCYEKVH